MFNNKYGSKTAFENNNDKQSASLPRRYIYSTKQDLNIYPFFHIEKKSLFPPIGITVCYLTYRCVSRHNGKIAFFFLVLLLLLTHFFYFVSVLQFSSWNSFVCFFWEKFNLSLSECPFCKHRDRNVWNRRGGRGG